MEIRIARTTDAGSLAELLLQFAGEDGTTTDRQRFPTDLLRWWETHRESHLPFLALHPSGAPTGMAWLALTTRVPRPGATSRRSGDVQSLYVVPEHRSAGVGTVLVRHAESLGVEHVTVHGNERSRRLYGRAGFLPSGDLLVWTAADPG